MRVLVWYWGRRGAGAQYTRHLVHALNAIPGAEVFVSLSSENPLSFETLGSSQGGQILEVHRPGGAVRAMFGPRRNIGAYARTVKADVVLHCMVSPHTIPAWSRFRGLPIVSVVHDPEPHPGDEKWFVDLAWRMALRRSTRIVSPSKIVAAKLRQRTAVPVDAIPFGPLIELVSPHDLWDPAGPITFAGRLAQYKGLDLLADAWSRLGDEADCQLVVAGEAPADGTMDAVLDQLTAVGADVRRGWLTESELGAILAGSRAVVLPYREASQSGLVPIAHALGIPVLATNVGALQLQVGDGGWIVDPSESGVREGLRHIMANPRSVQLTHDLIVATKRTTWGDVALEMLQTLEIASRQHQEVS